MERGCWVLSALCLWTAAGCGGGGDGGPWLEVSGGAQKAPEAGQRAGGQVSQQDLMEIFGQLGRSYEKLGSSEVEALRSSSQSLPRLKSLLSEDVTPEGIGAALALCQLREAEGPPYLKLVLEQGDADQKSRVLRGLPCVSLDDAQRRAYGDFLKEHEQLLDQLVVLIDDPDLSVARGAMLACGDLDLPQARGKLGALAARAMAAQGDLARLAERVKRAGLIHDAKLTAAVASYQRAAEAGEDRVPDLLELLMEADRLVFFDTESGMLPCRHDELIVEFAQYSGGAFRPEGASEEWHQKRPEDFEADYTLRFVHGGKQYTGRLRNYGDWYDVERTVEMINRALDDSGRPERFVSLHTGDQTAAFVCADPAVFRPLAQELGVELGGDLGEAMERGQQFEKEVLEQLQR